jgi:hypothetical protein
MSDHGLICTERYYPMWSSRGIRAVKCERPAKRLAFGRPFAAAEWVPVCGIHARMYEQTRPLAPVGERLGRALEGVG